MNEKDVPIIGLPQSVQFPQTQIQVALDKVVITEVFAPNCGFTITLNEQDMNNLCAEWLKTRQKVQQNLQTIEAVRKSKLA